MCKDIDEKHAGQAGSGEQKPIAALFVRNMADQHSNSDVRRVASELLQLRAENATLRSAAEKAATELEALATEYAKAGVIGVSPHIARNLRAALSPDRKGP